MTKKLNRLGIVIGLISISFFLTQCKKNDDVGLDLVTKPGDELNVHHVDTLDIISYATIVDSLYTTDVSTHLLGTYKDPIFGTTNAQFYTQIRLTENDIDFGSNAVCDSVVLALRLGAFYGDSNEAQTIKVFEVDELLHKDTNYYHFHKPAIVPTEIGQLTVNTFNTTDSVIVEGEEAAPQIRIPIDVAFGQRIVDKSGQVELSDNDNFIQFIKGLNVQATSAIIEGGMAYIDLTNAVTELRIYYHNDTDTSTMSIVVNEYCARHTVFDHAAYADADAQLVQQLNGDTNLGNQRVYVQSMGGIETVIKIPELQSIQNTNPAALAIAEMVFTVEDGTFANDDPPSKLVLVRISENGTSQFLTDYFEGTSYFGGVYDEATKTYTFRITRHIQKILKGELEDYGMRLLVSGGAVQANRAVLHGPDASTKPMKLKLIYTEVD